ncbi:hypothetical protein NKR23_g11770 [Pleurostoma richardsiae]|uniref:Extracellular serine-rich protein n=1 Tax=Pleurostoma richardsiae TaxID=41990 RepID=A0AA38R2J8_9PEZI|nr:hypothetical protein NKR23_g11770 [Pleurostoma richardsiae]
MRPTTLRSATAAAAVAQATAQSSSPSTTRASVTHTINVGAGGFNFDPESTSAAIGDVIEWQFFPSNHSVVRADFGYPCIPYEYVDPQGSGFFSGFRTVTPTQNDLPTFRITVTDSGPLFYYCSALHACVDEHMIGVINPNGTWDLDAQKRYLANATLQLSPGDPYPTEGGAISATGITAAPTSTAAVNTQGSSSKGARSTLETRQIVGIVVGVCAVFVLAAAIIYFVKRLRGRRKHETDPPGFRVDREDPQVHSSSADKRILQPGSVVDTSPRSHALLPDRWSNASPDLTTGSTGIATIYDEIRPEISFTGQPPAELPTQQDADSSIFAQPPRQLSWSPGSEMSYRPSKEQYS